MPSKLTTDQLRDRQRKYYETHRTEWNEYQREYKKKRYAEDLEFKNRTKEYQKEYYKLNYAVKKNTP